MNKNPLVSIVIPVYKGANYLAEAIDSALAQTYNNIEIIVVNDGSPDDGATERVALSYGKKIRYIYQNNGGVSSALNTGIREMKGEYFSWLSHDDLYEPTKIEKQVALIQGHDDIILCSGSLMDENKKPMPHPVKTLEGRLNNIQLFNAFLHDYALNGLGFLIPKHVFDEVGIFDESMRYLQDLDMWLRMLMHDKYTIVCQKDLLVVTRIHKNQQTNTISKVYDIDCKKLATKHIELIKTSLDILEKKQLFETYFKLFVKDGNKSGTEEVVKVLKQNGYNDFQLNMIAFPYYIKGKIKNIMRKVYNRILKMRGERT